MQKTCGADATCADGIPQRVIAKRLDVSQKLIYNIKTGRSYVGEGQLEERAGEAR